MRSAAAACRLGRHIVDVVDVHRLALAKPAGPEALGFDRQLRYRGGQHLLDAGPPPLLEHADREGARLGGEDVGAIDVEHLAELVEADAHDRAERLGLHVEQSGVSADRRRRTALAGQHPATVRRPTVGPLAHRLTGYDLRSTPPTRVDSTMAIATTNPATGETCSDLRAAHQGRDRSAPWPRGRHVRDVPPARRTTSARRGCVAAADILDGDRDAIAVTMTTEMGKTIGAARAEVEKVRDGLPLLRRARRGIPRRRAGRPDCRSGPAGVRALPADRPGARRDAVELPVLAGDALRGARAHGRQRRPAQARLERPADGAPVRGRVPSRRVPARRVPDAADHRRPGRAGAARPARARRPSPAAHRRAGRSRPSPATRSRRPCSSSAAATRSS